MKIARPTAERLDEIIEFFDWIDKTLVNEDCWNSDQAQDFIDELKRRADNTDYKIRHVVTVCQTLIEELCDQKDTVLKTRPDIIQHLQAAAVAEAATEPKALADHVIGAAPEQQPRSTNWKTLPSSPQHFQDTLARVLALTDINPAIQAMVKQYHLDECPSPVDWNLALAETVLTLNGMWHGLLRTIDTNTTEATAPNMTAAELAEIQTPIMQLALDPNHPIAGYILEQNGNTLSYKCLAKLVLYYQGANKVLTTTVDSRGVKEDTPAGRLLTIHSGKYQARLDDDDNEIPGTRINLK